MQETLPSERYDADAYITTEELAQRFKLDKHTLYNLVYSGRVKKNVHYVKMSARHMLWIWPEMVRWMHDPVPPARKSKTPENRILPMNKSLIRI